MSNNAHELSNRLLNALDNNYNVVDMHAVNEIISILERINITKELLETTRLGKHVNELRRKTSDPTLARRAKVLVKRWRDLVIPAVASPAHTGSNRSSAERQVRRLGGTPLTSPALSRQVVSPAVPSPRPPSRPAWGGYESDSQDVILVDDDPPPPPAPPAPHPLTLPHKPLTPPVKRPPAPDPLYDEKKAKRDKKPKKRRGHSRAGSGTEAAGPSPAPPPAPPAPPVPPAATPPPPPAGVGGVGAAPGAGGVAWGARNGAASSRRRNGCRRDALDPYAALATRMPPAGAKKVKTTKELLEQIQSRGTKPASTPPSPRSPASPDVMLIEPDSCPIKVESPLRNGGSSPHPPHPPLAACPPSPARAATPLPPLEDEREYSACTCGEAEEAACPAARRLPVRPLHVRALHHALVPGVNGTRAPRHPHQHAVRKPHHPDHPGLFASVVPLYKYSDYADDYCAKNMDAVPICEHLPWTEFAPPPPDPPPPPSPPPLRPYPIDFDEVKPEPKEEEDEDEDGDDTEETEKETIKETEKVKVKVDVVDEKPATDAENPKLEPEMVGVPSLEPSERLKAPLLSPEEETQFTRTGSPGGAAVRRRHSDVQQQFKTEPQEHRTVERTKEEALDGRALHAACAAARARVRYDYAQLRAAPVLALPEGAEAPGAGAEALGAALAAEGARDELARPLRPPHFAEWHECVRLGDLVALPYVVID